MVRGVGRGVYRHACPNCGGPIAEDRLRNRLPCHRCLPDAPDREVTLEEAYRLLKRSRTLRGLEGLYKLERESQDMIEFFTRVQGSRPWGAQRTWARRVARGDSFSIIAPTGTGKTTFGLIASIYYACKGLKSYIILPTTTLVVQALEKASRYAERSGCSVRVVAFHSKMRKREREEALKAIEAGEFDILITTSTFARSKVDLVASHEYRLVFVDDVDAVLRSARSVDTILRILGFTEEHIEKGLRMLKINREIAYLARRIQEASARRRGQAEQLRRRLARLQEEYESLRREIEAYRRGLGSLIVSSATGRPRGERVRLFRVLLGFEAGGRTGAGLRRVIDVYAMPSNGVYESVVSLVSRLGTGGLVYVPVDHGIEGAERLAEMLKAAGVRAEAFHSKRPIDLMKEFEDGVIDVLVGVANYYGTLVRGIDMPARVRYAVFAGVPRHRFPAEIGEPHPTRLLRLLSILAESDLEDVREEARRHLAALRRIVRRLSPAALQYIAERVLEGDVDNPGSPTWIVAEAYQFLRNALRDDEVWKSLSSRSDVGVEVRDGKKFLLIADVATYIQASGRTSRLYAGGITLGLSIVVVDDERVFNGLVRRTKWLVDAEWHSIEEIDLDDVIRRIDEDRKRVREILGGMAHHRDLVRTALLVVESPNKARTIAGFFGQPSIRILPGGTRAYEVSTGDYILVIAASGGHVYDLAQASAGEDYQGPLAARARRDLFGVILVGEGEDFIPVYTSIKRCMDCGHQFTAERSTCPVCGSPRIRDSRSTIEDLRRIAWEVDTVLVGTDPDTEGEKIGWDVGLLLKPYSRSMARLEFHEVTRRAITEALEKLRSFDQQLVDAQIVRRVEDRWIGFTLSPLLWCHFWSKYHCRILREEKAGGHGMFINNEIKRCQERRYYYNLSAGRVQTPTLGWIVNRHEETKTKVNLYTIRINGYTLQFREDEIPGEYRRSMQELAKKATKTRPVYVRVTVQPEAQEWRKLPPQPPYTTDAMIADASRYLRLGAPETMRLAQDLFEWGLITYHRTDSTRVSERGIQVAREWITDKLGNLAARVFKPRTWGEGGAHEAIRPVRPVDAETLRNLIEEGSLEFAGEVTQRHIRLYDLIFRRFMASQMSEAAVLVEKFKVVIEDVGLEREVEAVTRIGEPGDPASRGFAIVWPYLREQPRPPTGVDMEAELYKARISKVPPFTQGEIIRLMKERGIGRPSTYAKIIDTLFKRRYVTKPQATSDYVIPTIRGVNVYRYLTVYLPEYGPRDEGLASLVDPEYLRSVPRLVSEERTRFLEEAMDMIERGEKTRIEVLADVFNEIRGLAQPINEIASISVRGGSGAHGELYECMSRAYVVTGVGDGVDEHESSNSSQ